MSEKLERKVRLINGAKKKFEDCANKGENKEKCFKEAINWLKGTAEFQGVEISDEEIENLRVKWLEND